MGNQTIEIPPAGGSLAELSDVELTSPADAEVLTYDEEASKWINAESEGGGGGGATTIVELDDVSFGTPGIGDVIVYDYGKDPSKPNASVTHSSNMLLTDSSIQIGRSPETEIATEIYIGGRSTGGYAIQITEEIYNEEDPASSHINIDTEEIWINEDGGEIGLRSDNIYLQASNTIISDGMNTLMTLTPGDNSPNIQIPHLANMNIIGADASGNLVTGTAPVVIPDEINIETLADDKSLDATDAKYQFLDPDGADREITLALTDVNNKRFIIRNTAKPNTEYNLIVNVDAYPAHNVTLSPQQEREYYWDGNYWLLCSSFDNRDDVFNKMICLLVYGTRLSNISNIIDNVLYFVDIFHNNDGVSVLKCDLINKTITNLGGISGEKILYASEIVIDALGVIGFAYIDNIDNSYNDIMYAYYSDGSWTTETIYSGITYNAGGGNVVIASMNEHGTDIHCGFTAHNASSETYKQAAYKKRENGVWDTNPTFLGSVPVSTDDRIFGFNIWISETEILDYVIQKDGGYYSVAGWIDNVWTIYTSTFTPSFNILPVSGNTMFTIMENGRYLYDYDHIFYETSMYSSQVNVPTCSNAGIIIDTNSAELNCSIINADLDIVSGEYITDGYYNVITESYQESDFEIGKNNRSVPLIVFPKQIMQENIYYVLCSTAGQPIGIRKLLIY